MKFVLNETSYFGENSRENLPNEIKNRGFNKVLLVSDKALVEVGVTAKVEDTLKNAGIAYTLFDDIKPNPTIQNVLDGVTACKTANADVIVAVGGGSSIASQTVNLLSSIKDFPVWASFAEAEDGTTKCEFRCKKG